MKLRFLAVAAFAALFVCFAPSAGAAPQYAATLSVPGYTGTETLENFPVLVRLSEAIPGFRYADCAADGSDLSFADASGNALDYEIDTWDPAGTSLVWVRLPSLAPGGATSFTMGWCDDAPAAASATGVWTAADYASVWHLDVAANASSDAAAGYKATLLNPNAYAGAGAGLLGGGYHCEQNTVVHGLKTTSLAGFKASASGAMTFSGWFRQIGGTMKKGKPDAATYPEINWTSDYGNCGALFNSKNGGADTTGGGGDVDFNGAATAYRSLVVRDTVVTATDVTIESLYDKQWHHIAVVWDGTRRTMWLDGIPQPAFALNAKYGNVTGTVSLGARDLGSGNPNKDCIWTGDLDELRFRAAVSSEDWILAEREQVLDEAFVSFAAWPQLEETALASVSETSATFALTAPAVGGGTAAATLKAFVEEGGDVAAWSDAAATAQTVGTLPAPTSALFAVTGLTPNTTYLVRFALEATVGGALRAVTNAPFAFQTPAIDLRPTATVAVSKLYAAAADLAVTVPRFGYGATAVTALTLSYGTDPADESGWTSVSLPLPAAEGAVAAHRLLGLATGTTVYAKVRAVNDLSPAQTFESEAISFTPTAGDEPDDSQPLLTISGFEPAPGGLSISATVARTGFGSDAVRVLYRAAESEEGLASATPVVALTGLAAGADASFATVGLTPGRTVYVQAIVENGLGVVSESTVLSAIACADAMTVTVAGAAETRDVGSDRVAIFTDAATPGSFTTAEGGYVELLLVGGGGAGGAYNGGGGGAGGFLHVGRVYLEPGTYAIGVGAGGAPSTTDSRPGNDGGDSTFSLGGTALYTAHGGGGGGGGTSAAYMAGREGASGGGAGTGTAVAGAASAVSPERGHAGGANTKSITLSSGGGGAGAPGTHADYATGTGGAGGDGLPCSITGEEVWYAGGGGAGQSNGAVSSDGGSVVYGAGAGGRGGGGMGCRGTDEAVVPAACEGVDGLGGGGGGGRRDGTNAAGYAHRGARGGNGTVILRWAAVPRGAARAAVSSVEGAARGAVVAGTVLAAPAAGAALEIAVGPAGGALGAYQTLGTGLATGDFLLALSGLEANTTYDYAIRTADGTAAEGGAATGSFSTFAESPAALSSMPSGAARSTTGGDVVYSFTTPGTYTFTVAKPGRARFLLVGGGGAGGTKRGRRRRRRVVRCQRRLQGPRRQRRRRQRRRLHGRSLPQPHGGDGRRGRHGLRRRRRRAIRQIQRRARRGRRGRQRRVHPAHRHFGRFALPGGGIGRPRPLADGRGGRRSRDLPARHGLGRRRDPLARLRP